jgi:hypothetical protein
MNKQEYNKFIREQNKGLEETANDLNICKEEIIGDVVDCIFDADLSGKQSKELKSFLSSVGVSDFKGRLVDDICYCNLI